MEQTNINNMKLFYQIPIVEEIPMDKILEDPFCGVSGGEYDPKPGEFDPDSD